QPVVSRISAVDPTAGAPRGQNRSRYCPRPRRSPLALLPSKRSVRPRMTVLWEAAGPRLLRSAVCASVAVGGALPRPRPPRTKRRGSRTAAPIWPKLGAQSAPPLYPSALAAGRRLAPRPAPAARCSRGGGAPARVELLNRTRSHGRVG